MLICLLVTRWASKGLAPLRATFSCASQIPPPVVCRSVSKRGASARDTSSACAGRPGGGSARARLGAPRAGRRGASSSRLSSGSLCGSRVESWRVEVDASFGLCAAGKDEVSLREDALQRSQCHARRYARGRKYARGGGTDRAARARRRAPGHRLDWEPSAKRASSAPRPRNAAAEECVRRPNKIYHNRVN